MCCFVFCFICKLVRNDLKACAEKLGVEHIRVMGRNIRKLAKGYTCLNILAAPSLWDVSDLGFSLSEDPWF